MVQCLIGVVAFCFMLAIDVPLALIALSTMPILLWVSIRMRKVIFPVSWIIQARLAEVATIVDENINGVRVVKSFNQETPQIRALDDASPAWRGPTPRTPTSGPATRPPCRTSPRSAWPWCSASAVRW